MTELDSSGLGTWRTGGCGAKLERDVLVELVRGAFPQPVAAGLLLGLAEPDDAAAVEAVADQPVHAATDISGFGLVGHAANLAESSGVGVRIDASAVPVFEAARRLAEQGHETSITAANMRDGRARFEGGSPALRRVLHDPQTAGPLLLAIPRHAAPGAVEALRWAGYAAACVVGEIGEPTDAPVVVHAG